MFASLLLSSALVVLTANAQLDPVSESILEKVVDHAYHSNTLSCVLLPRSSWRPRFVPCWPCLCSCFTCYSWENGTLARALTDLYWAESLSVFSPNSIPPPISNSTINSIPPLLTLAQAVIDNKVDAFGADVFSNRGSLANGKSENSLSLLDDGSSADPASLGELIAWANWTKQEGSDHWADALQQEVCLWALSRARGKRSPRKDQGGVEKTEGRKELTSLPQSTVLLSSRYQIYYITEIVPRTNDGAISHRRDQVQLWSDFMYMAPPFIAYYAAMTNNETMMMDAYNQCKLYRKYLYDDDVQLYKREQSLPVIPSLVSAASWLDSWNPLRYLDIQLGSGVSDAGHWSTGNAWVAAGMIRIYGSAFLSPLPPVSQLRIELIPFLYASVR
jgi:hypothetical protein